MVNLVEYLSQELGIMSIREIRAKEHFDEKSREFSDSVSDYNVLAAMSKLDGQYPEKYHMIKRVSRELSPIYGESEPVTERVKEILDNLEETGSIEKGVFRIELFDPFRESYVCDLEGYRISRGEQIS